MLLIITVLIVVITRTRKNTSGFLGTKGSGTVLAKKEKRKENLTP